MTNELFSDLNFLRLDSKGRGINHKIFSLRELNDRYSFITFNKSDKKTNSHIIQNLQEELQDALQIIQPLEELMVLNEKLWGIKKDHSHISKALGSDLRKQIKQQLRIKQSCYDKLYAHYYHVKKEHKKETIMMLPILFGIGDALVYRGAMDIKSAQTKPLSTELIHNIVKMLNTSLIKMLKKLSKRKAYSVFKGCSHVVLLGERYIPYLQVIFYYTGDITDYFIRDMAREWCIANRGGVWLDYVRFDKNLPPDWDDEYEEFCDKGYLLIGENQYPVDVAVRCLILPFSKEYYDRLMPKPHDAEKNDNSKFIVEQSNTGNIKINPSFSEKERKKFVKHIKNTSFYHLFYLEQVAKQFTKIPKVTGITYKIFTYQKGYAPKKSNKS
ncbi:hypothetical protein [Providencia rettgeri]|uniref:hypothetical protein n=1 Tax=Providencia rettgeri TaxID=587 RepID=UPI001BACEE8E|nr:hypothetical protein [Providencia rettgeri]MBS0917590.1 hypothetical protein [Providencia rettgeri]